MTGSTILTIYDFQHIDLAASRLEGKADIAMTGFAGIAYAMKPVGEYDRPNSTLVRIIIEDNIAIFSPAFTTVESSSKQGHAQDKSN